MKKNILTVLIFLSLLGSIFAEQKMRLPNILWIVSEDNSAHYMSMYGDSNCSAPNLDKLSQGGLTFMKAYANAPVCAVARSTILTGAYAVTTGSQNMRSRYPAPQTFKSYVDYMRTVGYYCTNNKKTDYNIKMKDAAIWNECSDSAHYKNRPSKETPFFAVFNLGTTHESVLFPEKIKSSRDKKVIPPVSRVKPDFIKLQAYLPNLPELKEENAVYYDYISAMDKQVGSLVDELFSTDPEAAENTIIFYYSDHGGILPREKRNLQDSGTRVPFIVYFPEALRHLNPYGNEKRIESETISFVDLAPTVLSLAGLAKPEQMQGRAFLGSKRLKQEDKNVFTYASRYGERFYFSRAVTDGEFRYIRCFYAYKPKLIMCNYAFGQKGWAAWKSAFEADTLSDESKYWWLAAKGQYLYNTSKDPDEINNLAYIAEHSEKLLQLKERLKKFMLDSKDLSIIPEQKYEDILKDYPDIYTFARSKDFDYLKVFEAAWLASECDDANENSLRTLLKSENPYVRYWAAIGLLNLASEDVDEDIALLYKDSESMNRALSFMLLGRNLEMKKDAIDGLINMLDFTQDAQANSLRTFIISEVEELGADKNLVADLLSKNEEAFAKSKVKYTSN